MEQQQRQDTGPAFEVRAVPGKGMGIGLPLTKKMIEKHHGYLQIETQEKSGTCFSVVLKLAKPLIINTKNIVKKKNAIDTKDDNGSKEAA